VPNPLTFPFVPLHATATLQGRDKNGVELVKEIGEDGKEHVAIKVQDINKLPPALRDHYMHRFNQQVRYLSLTLPA